MRIKRYFTEQPADANSAFIFNEDASPYNRTTAWDLLEWNRRESRIVNPDGTVVFEARDIEVPAAWSQVA
ncbi:MAG: hypothetical protein KDK27_06645, partial [Leptospiraceae bacterium]|nr:hypothetical protein [Leptospiraceae bacterium]